MARSKAAGASNRKAEVVIAAIGLLGVLGTAVFSNWDKLYPPPNVVKAEFTGYVPTGDPQIELRYFFEITGMRSLVQGFQAEMLGHFKQQIEQQYEDNPGLVGELIKVMREELGTQYDQILNIYVPIATKHFSVAEIQELNKFYSTPPMREMTRRTPLLTKEYMPLVLVMAQKTQERMGPKVQAILEKHGQ